MTDIPVEIKYSTKRKKTISAIMKNDILVISAPKHINKKVLEEFILKAQRKIRIQEENKKVNLLDLAEQLMKKYFPKKIRNKIGTNFSIEYVDTQKSILGNCHYEHRSIRLSDVLIFVPDWVRNYVIIHELAHLIEPNHSQDFWNIVNHYPYVEKSKLFLKGLFFGVENYQKFAKLKAFEM